MVACFTFQWGGFVFQMGETSFLSGGCAPWGTLVLMGGFKKNRRMVGAPSMPPPPSPTMGNPDINV